MILVLLVGLAPAALPGPTTSNGVDQSAFGRSAPRAVPPQRFFAPEDANETLHFDSDPASGVGLTNGGTFWGGVRFTPTTACTLKTLLFYQWNSSGNDYIFVFGENNDTTPGARLDSVAYSGTDSMTWKAANLASPLVLPAGIDFWVAVRLNSSAGAYPLGVDAGPNVHDHGGFISTNGTRWQNLPDDNPALDFNWNIRAVVAVAPSPSHDVTLTRILAPGTYVPVGAYAPACRIVNVGANAESDIPVTCWIDSAGTHIYNKDTVFAGPLAPGARADITFAPDWQTGPAGNTYNLTMFTGLGGDLNNGNDTARQSTSVASRFIVMDHDTGYCKLTVSCLGSIGYDAPPSLAGNGFFYPKTASKSALFYSSLALGNDTNWVADRYYSHPTSGAPNSDFVPSESLSAIVPPGIGDQHYRGVYSDAGHPSPKGLTVTQNSYMSADSAYDDFVVLDYAITNEGASAVTGIYAGVFADFDVGDSSALNLCRSDTVARSLKMWWQNHQNPTVGLKILAPGWFRNLSAVDHNIWVYPDSCVTDNQKYRFLNGSIVLRNSNRPYDWSVMASIGPFDLAPDDSQKFAVAFIGAADTATFTVNAESAQAWYAANLGVAERHLDPAPAVRIAAAPNPFSRATRISFSASAAGRLEIEAYDAAGRLADRLAVEVKAGPGAINWRPRQLGAGLYFLKVKTPGREAVIKTLLTE